MPTAPAAPDLFVRTTGCFRIFASAAANGRPERSAWPPGGYGLTIVMVRDGNASCAAAGPAPSSTRTATTRNLVMRPPVCGAGVYRVFASATPRQVRRQKAPRLIEARRRGPLVVAWMSPHREAVAGAVIEPELAGFAERPHPRFHLTHARDRGLLVFRAVQDQHGDVHARGEVVRLSTGHGIRRPEGEAMEDDDHPDLVMRAGGHERVDSPTTEAEHRQPRLVDPAVGPEKGQRSLQIVVHGGIRG